MEKTWQLYINGRWVGAQHGKTFDVVNPATQDVIAQVPDGGPAEAHVAVEAAADAFPCWSRLSGMERGRLLAKTHQLMMERCDALAHLVTQENDADLREAVEGAAAIKFMRVAGQSCICANRIFVQESIAAHFIPAFIDRVRAIKVGDGFQPGVEVGPLINEATLHKVESLVQDAVAKGAQVAVGGQRLRTKELSKGWFYAPTVLQATPHRPGGALADAQSPAAYQSDPP